MPRSFADVHPRIWDRSGPPYGGATIQGFLAAGLVDEIIVTVIPVVLGGGISPFGKMASEVALTQLHAEVFDFGFVQITYSVGAK